MKHIVKMVLVQIMTSVANIFVMINELIGNTKTITSDQKKKTELAF